MFEASFITNRFVNYRAYKFNFTSSPTDWPAAKAFAGVNAQGNFTTIVYASWDGATEVHSWAAYAVESDDDPGTAIGGARKTGFETSFVCQGHYPRVFVEAVDKHGEVLSRSAVVETELPLGWHELLDEGYARKRERGGSQVFTFFAGMAAMFLISWVKPRQLRSWRWRS